MRWFVALVIGFTTLFVMDGLLLYLAISGGEPVAASYTEGGR